MHDAHSTPPAPSVEVFPFRAWRVADQELRRLAARYATPWDQDAGHRYTSALEAANTFRAWQRSGALVRDHWPAFYAYEQSGPRGSQRGLVSAVHVDSTLLPHEQILPDRVDGIAELLRTGEMSMDPLLLAYSGDGRASSHLAAATRRPPVTDVLASDGQRHRLWLITERDIEDDICDELSRRPAFLADGHHRLAAARQLRRQLVAEGYAEGPWEMISGLLVDVRQYRPQLAPIHRVLPFTDPAQALRAATGPFRVTPLGGDLTAWLRTLKQQARRGPAFVVATPRGVFLLTDPDQRFLTHRLERWPAPLRRMHLGVLHASLIGALWKTPDAPSHVWYESSPTKAVDQVREYGGVAVLLAPPRHADLVSAASAGLRLPCKSTSFRPKPHPGLLFHTWDE